MKVWCDYCQAGAPDVQSAHVVAPDHIQGKCGRCGYQLDIHVADAGMRKLLPPIEDIELLHDPDQNCWCACNREDLEALFAVDTKKRIR